MAIKKRDVVFMGKNAAGDQTIDMPITRLGNIEDDAEIKTSPSAEDYIPIMDMADGGQMKKTPYAVPTEGTGGEITPEGLESLIFDENIDPDKVVNKNYLGNWNFAEPVNTSGETTWTAASTAHVNILDGQWYIYGTNNTASVKSSGYLLINGYNSSSSSGGASSFLYQDIALESVLGKTVTVTCLCRPQSRYTEVSVFAGTDKRWKPDQIGGTTVTQTPLSSTTALGICTATFTFPDEVDSTKCTDPTVCTFWVQASQSSGVSSKGRGAYVEVYACKLEISDSQTLAYQDENGKWAVNLISTEGETVDLNSCIASANRIMFYHLEEKNSTPFAHAPTADTNGTLIAVNYSGAALNDENLKCKQIFISAADGKSYTRYFNAASGSAWSEWVLSGSSDSSSNGV